MVAVRVGDRVTRRPQFPRRAGNRIPEALRHPELRGTVVYVHPEGRYHVVSFPTRDGSGEFREAFPGTARDAEA